MADSRRRALWRRGAHGVGDVGPGGGPVRVWGDERDRAEPHDHGAVGVGVDEPGPDGLRQSDPDVGQPVHLGQPHGDALQQPLATPAAFQVQLGAGDDGGTARVLRGGKVVVELPDPGGAQSAWFIQEGTVDLESTLAPYCAQWDTAMQHLQVMTFEAVAVGTVPLRLKYNRVESTAVPTDTFAVTVSVVDGPGALTPGTDQDLVRVSADDAGSTVRLAANQRLRVGCPRAAPTSWSGSQPRPRRSWSPTARLRSRVRAAPWRCRG